VAGADYLPASGTLTFNPGQTNKNITVAVIAASEPDKFFYVNLSNPVNAFLGDNQGICTITKLLITDFSVDPVITFKTVAGHIYAVDKTDSLSDLYWQPLPNAFSIQGTGGTVSISDHNGGCQDQRHYRVRLVQ
jgi:hypothetical protein